MRIIAAAALSAVLAGCAGMGGTQKLATTFDAAEAAALLRPGANTITGSAMLRQVGGAVVTCAGTAVTLVPATAYAKERVAVLYQGRTFRSIYAGHPQFEPNPPEYGALARRTTCNPQGFFKFDNVSDGDFLITTTVSWGTPPYGVPTGGHLVGAASVRGGQTVELTLAQ